ncbi:MAG: dihydropteroate synthase [Verrucomicrobiales bacterium]|jgi:dihydropteroate synthase
MGILNTTPDSFSDGGEFSELESAVAHGLEMEAQGAAILDVGGESTRPGAAEVSVADELERVVPVIRRLAAKKQPETLLSIDTSKAAVAAAAVEAGADIINDVTGLLGDVEMLDVAAKCDAGLVVMHMKGTPRTMQAAPEYGDVVGEVQKFFEQSLARCKAVGIDPLRLCFDPGIGFGKTLKHNLTLLRSLPQLRVGDRPLLLGVSRKSFIGKLVGSNEISDRSWGTVALTAHAREAGVEIHRVHEVRANLEALRMAEAILWG